VVEPIRPRKACKFAVSPVSQTDTGGETEVEKKM